MKGYEDTHPYFNIIVDDNCVQNEDMLNEALQGLKSLEGQRIDELLKSKMRMYKNMIEEAGFKVLTNTTLTDIEVRWTAQDVANNYKKYINKSYSVKENYSRIEINNMLFDLKASNIIRGYSCVALPYSFAEKYNNEIFMGTVEVALR